MTALVSKIRMEVEKNGTLSFARFMELALYDPDGGYYEQSRPIGRDGDFFTSVSVGSLFGELLAHQFADWFAAAATSSKKFQIIEAGAHDGRLAADILSWFKTHRPHFFGRLQYCILEPSVHRQSWQKKNVSEFQNIFWAKDFANLLEGKADVYRIIFSNELFDAMPVRRLGWDAKTKSWFEWGVSWEADRFIWKRLLENEHSPVPYPQLPCELLAVLPDGFIIETCPAASAWWTAAASILDTGKLIAIDYGLAAEEFLTPERSNGTARAYFKHHSNLDLLAQPGEQDITSHVDFSALLKAGESAGLKTDAFISQAKFLTGIAGRFLFDSKSERIWDEKKRKQFQTLTHPEHLGRSFRVLMQSR